MNGIDKLILNLDQALRTLVPGTTVAERANPAAAEASTRLDDTAATHAAGLMRINHTGEICAQALYQGQALTAQLPEVRAGMEQAAREEGDHLAWCESRLTELGSRPSLLNPLWYGMSFGLGAIAGLAGDRWSLGFVAETENQVCEHLRDHLTQLPADDQRSKAILRQMLVDEGKHETQAREAGGMELPSPIKNAMTLMARVMKTTVYKI
jgi:ubiquinone biosynthesis monooxygenase Coq7